MASVKKRKRSVYVGKKALVLIPVPDVQSPLPVKDTVDDIEEYSSDEGFVRVLKNTLHHQDVYITSTLKKPSLVQQNLQKALHDAIEEVASQTSSACLKELTCIGPWSNE